jgi:hypothetical protein
MWEGVPTESRFSSDEFARQNRNLADIREHATEHETSAEDTRQTFREAMRSKTFGEHLRMQRLASDTPACEQPGVFFDLAGEGLVVFLPHWGIPLDVSKIAVTKPCRATLSTCIERWPAHR